MKPSHFLIPFIYANRIPHKHHFPGSLNIASFRDMLHFQYSLLDLHDANYLWHIVIPSDTQTSWTSWTYLQLDLYSASQTTVEV